VANLGGVLYALHASKPPMIEGARHGALFTNITTLNYKKRATKMVLPPPMSQKAGGCSWCFYPWGF
jgi:hypothetical protein